MKKHALLLAIVAGALLASPTEAFWSKYLFAALKIHQGITSQALGDNSFTYQGDEYSFDQKAIDAVNDVHATVDNSSNYFAAEHFDSESFSDAYDLLQARRDQLMALLQMQGADQNEVWNLLGYMLHAMQDFYSHSSYIANGGSDPVDFSTSITGNTTPSFILSPDAIGVVCSGGSVLLSSNSAVTTGYFDVSPLPTGKCQHGNLYYAAIIGCGNTAAGAPFVPDGINHDHPCFSDPTDIAIFGTAQNLAVQESSLFVQGIVDELSANKNDTGLCLLLGLPSDQAPCQTAADMGTCSDAKSCVNWIVGSVAFEADPCDSTVIQNYCLVESLQAVVPSTVSANFPSELSLGLLGNGETAIQSLQSQLGPLPLSYSGSTSAVTVSIDANDPTNTTDITNADAFVGFPTSAVATSSIPQGYPTPTTAQFSSAYLQNHPAAAPGSVTFHFEIVSAPTGGSCQPGDTSCVVATVYASGSFSFEVDDPAQLVQYGITIGPNLVTGTFYFPNGTCYNAGADQSGNPMMYCNAG